MRYALWICFIMLACSIGSSAQAAVSYSYIADSTTYSGAVGSQVTVNLFLLETLTSGSTSFINSKGGLTNAGAAVNVVGTLGGTAAQIPNAGYTPSSAFPGPLLTFYNQGTTPAKSNNLEFTEAVTSGSVAPDVTSSSIFLGKLLVTVGSGSTTYILTSLGNDTITNSSGGNSQLGQVNGNTLTQLPAPFGTDLDVTQQGVFTGANASPGFTFKVNATPEPASMGLLGLCALSLLARRRVVA